ncbi:Hypothetical protein GSB_152373 [Giardia duodenalis]|uniref:Uncharacterized protein n=1 Tax=Giardia intestinalis TaxID=5741 RepID=V6TRM2_GIAIN|nr:Hypothetical protein GSB_152373 [Giardia intestinalis]
MDQTLATIAIQAAFRGYHCRAKIRSLWNDWLDQVRTIERSPNLCFGHHLPLLVDHQPNFSESRSPNVLPTKHTVYSHGASPYAYSVRRLGEIPPNSIIGPSIPSLGDSGNNGIRSIS